MLRHRTARTLASIIGIEAIVVMAGWVFGIDWMTRIAPESVSISMKFTTAFLFLFSTIGLQCVSRMVQEEDEVADAILPGIALTMAIITVSMLMGRLLSIPTGIESLFVPIKDPVTLSSVIPTAGIPSIATLVNFMVFGFVGIGTAFFIKIRTLFLTGVGILIIATGGIALLGYVFRLPALYYDFGSSVPMALNTALCFVLLGIGTILVSKAEKTQ